MKINFAAGEGAVRTDYKSEESGKPGYFVL